MYLAFVRPRAVVVVVVVVDSRWLPVAGRAEERTLTMTGDSNNTPIQIGHGSLGEEIEMVEMECGISKWYRRKGPEGRSGLRDYLHAQDLIYTFFQNSKLVSKQRPHQKR